ncbi:MAG: lytic transglycosylase domain-containing protein [Hyphomicrobiales bacterium]|nr:MAG: lytic transglycosylase domain-containing protein [Hyphomicrobiales bacterium]
MRWVRLLQVLLVAALWPVAAAARTDEADQVRQTCTSLSGSRVCIGEANYTADVCRAISSFAARWQLPEAFFARLIWQESRFDPLAISSAGAQGIAQFMPGTARIRNLGNAFDPAEALARSAEYLRFLHDKFGNLGLAAAAYNGGERRLETYVGKGGGLAPETRNYVAIITGYSAAQWLAEPPAKVDFTLMPDQDFHAGCLDMAKAVKAPDLTTDPAQWQPWGVLVAQNASAERARSRFEDAQARFGTVLASEKLMLITVRNPSFGRRTRFSAMVGRPTRAEAEQLCKALAAAGGNCIVQKTQH